MGRSLLRDSKLEALLQIRLAKHLMGEPSSLRQNHRLIWRNSWKRLG
jgi:hypothetical protein